MKITCIAFVLIIQASQCLASDDSYFTLVNKDTGFCLVNPFDYCEPVRWTTGDRILVLWSKKCLGVQGKSVGSQVTLYDCDENSDLQKWECKNETVLALKGQELYIELKDATTAVLSRTIGPNSHLTVSGSISDGPCSRTYREYFTIGGNANGRPCMFPFYYKDNWYSECTELDKQEKRSWCAVETHFNNELWGYCPTSSKTHWNKHITTGDYYQLNTQSALTWTQAEKSCKQQHASLLSISDPHELAYITALLSEKGAGQGDTLWTGLVLDSEHGWQWTNGRPYRYLNWDSGHPHSSPGHNCGIMNSAVQYSWQSSSCTKRLGYICYSKKEVPVLPTEATQPRFCSSPWIPFNGHCFYLNRTRRTWTDAQRECRKEGGDLVSIQNVEEQSFVISQLGYASTDELWIGLNDRKTEGLFDWSDHATVSFTSWEYGKPVVRSAQEDCVLIKGENGNWADRVCSEKHGYICMKSSVSERPTDEVDQNVGCKAGWKKHGSYCYFVGTETKTFDGAKEDCKSSDSYLADVSTGVDNAFLVSLVGLRPEKYFWLGLSNQKNIEFFVWTNTDKVRFTHWNTDMPGHLRGCVAMTTGVFAGLWDVLPCTNKEKYICKHLAEGAVVTQPPPTVAPPKCASGWSPVASRSYCYKVYGKDYEQKTWYEARDYCRAIGGDLLSIHSEPELRLSKSYFSVWIGLNAPDPLTGYVWSDGSPVNFLHWFDGQPNNKNNVQSCAEFYLFGWHHSGSWNDLHCETYRNWVCQIRAGVTPKPYNDTVTPDYNKTSDGWLEWGGNQYFVNEKLMVMEDARHYCKQRHGDLVTINSEAESVFLWKLISRSENEHWIGLTVDLDETSQWMDGSQVAFLRWDEDQPKFKNYDENCVVMESYHGFWHDYDCGNEFRSICKRSSSAPVNTTVAPTEAPKGGCTPGWKKFKSKCYKIIKNQNVTWDEGRKQCRSMDGKLVSIPSRHEQAFLVTEMAATPSSDFWIGLRYLHSGQLSWIDGRARKYLNLNRRDRFYWAFRRYKGWFPSYIYTDRCAVISGQTGAIGKWILKSCNDTNDFICHRNVDPALPDDPEPTRTEYVKIANDSIKAVTQQMTWDAAKKYCENDGAKLISIRNEWSQAYLELLAKNLNASLWIGMNKAETKGYFRYIDGWHMSFSHWGYNEPSSDKPCVYVDVDGRWYTTFCNQTMNGVCMKSQDVPPTDSSAFPGVCPEDPDPLGEDRNTFWRPFKGHCYIFFNAAKSWSLAATSCQGHGATLVSIEDPTEQEFLENALTMFKDGHPSFWIGLYKTHKGEWLWLDKTVMDYTKWGQDEPNDHTHGVISTSDGTWKTERWSWYSRPYICKAAKVMPTSISLPSQQEPELQRLRGHIILAVVLIITGLAMGTVIALFIFKKNSHRLPILERLTNFENPLFRYSQSQPDVADTSNLVENAEEENPEPLIITI
ncbi:macrophage mannose receptor 1 [Larimichthys crocea]|uniref:macrophage mannose receptor 1 n=1 Tax=Larimichthys crocea TaxID=215358 RepID=UPI000901A9BF|nr:macrophage mannose receptor 1 [Larimichthys crocea]